MTAMAAPYVAGPVKEAAPPPAPPAAARTQPAASTRRAPASAGELPARPVVAATALDQPGGNANLSETVVMPSDLPAADPNPGTTPSLPAGALNTSSVVPGGHTVALGAPPSPSVTTKTGTPWNAAADAGVSIGRGSKTAAVSTAGFFTRLSKKVAGSFRDR
jgi:hypothetical protein